MLPFPVCKTRILNCLDKYQDNSNLNSVNHDGYYSTTCLNIKENSALSTEVLYTLIQLSEEKQRLLPHTALTVSVTHFRILQCCEDDFWHHAKLNFKFHFYVSFLNLLVINK